MDCKDCIKTDVCNQKKILDSIKEEIDKISIGLGDNSFLENRYFKSNYGIEVSVKCNRFSQKPQYTIR